MRKESADVIVCGGGFTGLYAADKLARHGFNVILISQDMGGLIGSYSDNGFTFDYGGHVYSAGDARLAALLDSVGGRRHERKAYYHIRANHLVDYPVQDRAEELGMKITGETQGYHGQDLEDFAVKTFGDEFYDRWFRPFNRRVWTTEPPTMDSDWVAGRVKTPRETSFGGWGPNSEFYYAPGSRIIEQLQKQALSSGVEIFHGDIIRDSAKGRSFVARIRGNMVKFTARQKIFWTLPIAAFLGEVGLPLDNLFKRNRVRTIGIGLKTLLPEHFSWIYCNIDSPIHRITLLSRYHPSMAPDGKDSLLLEIPWRRGFRKLPVGLEGAIGDSSARESHRRTAWKALEMAHFDEIHPWLRLSDIETAMMGECYGYPIPMLGLRTAVATIKKIMFDRGVVFAGRWGSWGYFNLEHCMMDVDAAAKLIVLDNDEWRYEYEWSPFYYKPYAKA